MGGNGRGSGSAARPERRSSSSWVTSGRQAATSSRVRVEPAAMSSSVSARSSSRSAGTGGGGCADRHAQLTRCPWSPGGPNVVTVGTSATSAPTQITASPAATASTVRSRGPASPCGSPGRGSATRSARAPRRRAVPSAAPRKLDVPPGDTSGRSVTVWGSSSPCTRATTSSRVTCPVSQLPAQAVSCADRGSPSMSVSLRVAPAVGSSPTPFLRTPCWSREGPSAS